MTKKSKDKIFGALDPEKKKNRNTENELMSFYPKIQSAQ
jgi:hypothetical protein